MFRSENIGRFHFLRVNKNPSDNDKRTKYTCVELHLNLYKEYMIMLEIKNYGNNGVVNTK